MKGYNVHSSPKPVFPCKGAAPSNLTATPIRRGSRLELRLFICALLLLAAAFACHELVPLFETRLEADSSARLLGYLLSRMPFALRFWQGLALLLYAASVWMLISIAYRGQRWLPRLAMLAVALAMEPFYRDLRDFGVQWLALASISLSFFLHDRKSNYGAGLMLAIAVMIQPCALAAPVYFLWRRRFVYAFSALALAALMTLAAWLLYGIPLLAYDADSLRAYAMSFGVPWPSTSLNRILAMIGATLGLAVLVLMTTSVPHLRGTTRNRFDYLFACLCIVLFSPAASTGELLPLLVCYLMLVGIVAEKYAEASASLQFAVPERWAALFAALSFLATLMSASTLTDRLEAYIAFFAVKLLIIPVGFLAWKLGRIHSSPAIRLSDYQLRRNPM